MMGAVDWKAILSREVPSLQWLSDAPSDVVGISVPESEAVAVWRRLVELVPQTHRWPVVIGGDDRWEEELARMSGAPDGPETILEAAFATDFVAWLQREIADARADAEALGDIESRLDAPRGSWPDEVETANSFGAHLEGGDRRGPGRAGIALVPTPRGWEAPAYLRFGGWNSCPCAEVQVAALKSWHERYGADVFAIAGDTVEMSVARPPMTREAAIELAFEQYAYCTDIVDQGAQSIEMLAAGLLGASVWFFWWD